jgi:hypothetical protein
LVQNQPAKQASGTVAVDTVKGGSIENLPIPRSQEPPQAQSTDAPAPAPPQTNEATASDPAPNGNQATDDSTSKPKKKSGLRKLMHF